MSIAQLPPQNHINALRSFLNRIQRQRTTPSRQEIAHAEESLAEIEKAINQQKGPTT